MPTEDQAVWLVYLLLLVAGIHKISSGSVHYIEGIVSGAKRIQVCLPIRRQKNRAVCHTVFTMYSLADSHSPFFYNLDLTPYSFTARRFNFRFNLIIKDSIGYVEKFSPFIIVAESLLKS